MQGYLEKKSPNLLKGWQKRFAWYFKDAQVLLYFLKKPDDGLLQPNGYINLKDVVEIDPLTSYKPEFKLVTNSSRVYELMATSTSEKQLWIKAFLGDDDVESFNQKNQFKKKQNQLEKKKTEWSDIAQETLKLVYLEKETFQTQSTKFEDQVQEEVLNAKGILSLLTKLTSYQIENFIYKGFMEKLRKNSLTKTRWFYLFSTVNNKGAVIPKQQQQESNLTAKYNFNTIYYFKFENSRDKTAYRGYIPVKNIADLELFAIPLDKQNIEYTPFGFRFMDGQKKKKYTLYTKTFTQAQKWCEIIECILNYFREQTTLEQQKKEQNAQEGQQEQQQKKKKRVGYKKKKIVEENQYQMEGSFEMKINKNQWKNAIVQLNNDQIFVTLVDQENTRKYWQYSINRIQCLGRTWTLEMNEEEDLTFRCGTIKEREEWVEELAELTERELFVDQFSQLQKQPTMLQSGYNNSLKRTATTTVSEIENPQRQNDSTFSALFNCCSRPQTSNLE